MTAATSPMISAMADRVWQGPFQRGSGMLEWLLAEPALPAEANPFDPDQFDLWVEFHGPNQRRMRATAFWRQSPGAANGHWAVRWLPPLAGVWRARPGGYRHGQALQPGQAFEHRVQQVLPRQRVVVDPLAPTHFAFEDGTPFVPVGLNVCWAGPQGLEDYRRWFTRLAAQGGNFARLWMASWSFGLEWKDTGLGDYRARMDRAEQLDQVFELAASLGIRLMLCLLNHGAFTERNDSEWADNPYNRAQGGPLAEPQDFVTDEQSQRLFERRVRYIAARWSASPALHSWEWWNEVTWTPIEPAALRPWLERMGRVLDQHDPYRRLRSTSWADRGDREAWLLPTLDYVQQHDYTTQDPLQHYARSAHGWREDGLQTKPWLPGELGLYTTPVERQAWPCDADAIHLHNGLWAPLFLGYASTALYWWWDHLVDPEDLWPLYRGVSRWLEQLHAQGLRLGLHRQHDVAFSGGPATALALVGPASVLLWVRADLQDASAQQAAWCRTAEGQDAATPWQTSFAPLTGAGLQLQGLPFSDGPVQVHWSDTLHGETVAQTTASLAAGRLSLACPTFHRGLAVTVRPLRGAALT